MAGITVGIEDRAGKIPWKELISVLPVELCHQDLLWDVITSLDGDLIQHDSPDGDPSFRPYDFDKLRELILEKFSDEEDSPLPGNQEPFLKVCEFARVNPTVYFHSCY